MNRKIAVALGVAIFAVALTPAANPPGLINYQGVLRDSQGQPLDGPHDFVFRFFDAETFGNELLIDLHLAGSGGQIMVTGGLFNAVLFGGTVLDGSSSRPYNSAADVFSINSSVWLQVEVGSSAMPMEVLSPRVRIVSAPYAVNAGFAQNAVTLDGNPPGQFLDISPSPQTKFGQLALNEANLDVPALDARGSNVAAQFTSNGSGVALAAIDTYGIYATGDPSIVGYNAGNSTGIIGSSSIALAGYAYSLSAPFAAAGYFEDYYNNTFTWLGRGGEGVTSRGSVHGGFFESWLDGSAKAWLAGDPTPPLPGSGYDPTWGIWAEGAYAWWTGEGGGGYFKDPVYGAYAKVGHENYGVQGFGNTMGGYFKDTDQGGEAHLGEGARGLNAYGTEMAAGFAHPDFTSFWAYVATPVHKVAGTGAVSFVQNHPHDPSRVIVYAAPEGDEVATYTRGTARLGDGRARVVLGETFPLVTNPDIGLTAHLTPRGEAVPIAVESLSTAELVVTGPRGSDAEFDYIVYGLRIGFEESAVVQPKEREARLPEQAAIDAPMRGDESLRPFRAFERFARMEEATGRSHVRVSSPERAADSPGAAALRRAIDAAGVNEVGKRKVYGPEMTSAADPEAARAEQARREKELARRAAQSRDLGPESTGPSIQPAGPRPAPLRDPAPAGAAPADREASRGLLVVTLPFDGEVQAFDLLTAAGDPAGGIVRTVSTPGDRAVVGIALEPRENGSIDVVVAGLTTLRVDASIAPIAIGDLLSASATPGHAMRSPDAAAGTIVAKALEPLDSGTGLIRVLVLPR